MEWICTVIPKTRTLKEQRRVIQSQRPAPASSSNAVSTKSLWQQRALHHSLFLPRDQDAPGRHPCERRLHQLGARSMERLEGFSRNSGFSLWTVVHHRLFADADGYTM